MIHAIKLGMSFIEMIKIVISLPVGFMGFISSSLLNTYRVMHNLNEKMLDTALL
jgi:hypothetical protein